MTAATIASVAERRAMLKGLGQRPSFEAVEQAKQALAGIDGQLAESIQNANFASAPAGRNAAEWRKTQESKVREAAEKEKIPYKSVILLSDLHQSYEDILEQEEQSLDGRKLQARVGSLSSDDKSHAEASRLLQDAVDGKREKLDLNNRHMSHISETFGRIVTLVSLDISNNKLQVIPESVAGLVNLESLKANSNQLKTLPTSIGLLSKLKYLDVSSNALRHLPESLGRCTSLVEINAHFNQLEFISANFGFMLVNLVKLELHLNNLNFLPASVCQLKSLKYLDLHMNKLKGLPSSFGNLSQLQYLDVSSNFNDLLVLSESLGNLVSLTYCDLSFNQIRELPDSLGRLEKLKTLRLDGNPLVVPPMEVVEHSHDAVMEYLQRRWMRSNEGDLQGSAGGNSFSLTARNDYSPCFPAWAGNSVLVGLMGSLCGGVGTIFGGGTRNIHASLRYQRYQQDAPLEQHV